MTQYFLAGGKPVCPTCKATIEQAVTAFDSQGNSPGAMLRAVLFGFVGAIAGAAVYYGFVAITHIEWALIAIAVAWIVGKAVRAGSRNRGGLRYQLLAVFFTYFALGLAYVPLMLGGSASKSVLSTIILALEMPVLVATQSGFAGIINVIITIVGLLQAWRMNAASLPTISGPYRVGATA